MSLPSVELRPAFNWTCEGCGSDNFQVVLLQDVREAPEVLLPILRASGIIREDQGLDDIPEGVDCTAQICPEEVVCKQCQAKFKTDVSANYYEE